MRSDSTATARRSSYRDGGGKMVAVMTRSALKPASSVRRLRNVVKSRPAPNNRTNGHGDLYDDEPAAELTCRSPGGPRPASVGKDLVEVHPAQARRGNESDQHADQHRERQNEADHSASRCAQMRRSADWRYSARHRASGGARRQRRCLRGLRPGQGAPLRRSVGASGEVCPAPRARRVTSSRDRALARASDRFAMLSAPINSTNTAPPHSR